MLTFTYSDKENEITFKDKKFDARRCFIIKNFGHMYEYIDTFCTEYRKYRYILQLK